MGREDEEAYVTLTTNDVYAVGALVLARSLRLSGTTRRLVCLLTPDGVSPFYRSALSRCYDELLDVPSACDLVTGAPHERPDAAAKFTKLQCWKLVQYRKCVFLDSDTLVLHNCDDLFDRAELSACPDPGWPDLFNTGVFVFTPSHTTYDSLLQFAKANEGCCEGGEQGLLNAYFSDWLWTIARHLPFVYNVIPQSFYSYHPAVRRFAPGVKICHFAGYAKPWHRSVNAHTGRVVGGSMGAASDNDAVDYLQRWWDVLSDYVLPLFQQCAETQPSREELAAAEAVVPPAPSAPVDAAEAQHSHGNVPSDVSSIRADFGSIQMGVDRLPESDGRRVAESAEVDMHAEQPCQPLSMDERREAWEDYNMDYKGGDGFDFVLEALQNKLAVSDKSNGGSMRDGSTSPLTGSSPEQSSHARPGLTTLPPLRANTEEHRAMWERGQIDYSGVDRFDNILKQLESRLTAGTSGDTGEVADRAQAPSSSSLGRTGGPQHGSRSAAADGSRRLSGSGSGSSSPQRVALAFAEPTPKLVLVAFPHHWC